MSEGAVELKSRGVYALADVPLGALRGYARSDKKNMPKLARYAEALGAAGELRDLMEVVQW